VEDINAQQHIREYSVQSFRKICDRLVLDPPSIPEEADIEDKRFILLDTLYVEVLKYAGAPVPETPPAERPGPFLLKHRVIEALGRYWRVHSMNLETIIDEFVFNAIRHGQNP